MRYFLGLGSNIAPREHLPRMLLALLQLTPRLHVGRVLQTVPVGVKGDPFLNVPVSFSAALTPPELKRVCNAIEVAFGRDRDDPASKLRSRRADLDLLFALDEAATHVPPALLPHEPYMRPMLLELLGGLGLTTVAETPALAPGVALELAGLPIGPRPVTVARDGGQYILEPLAAQAVSPVERR